MEVVSNLTSAEKLPYHQAWYIRAFKAVSALSLKKLGFLGSS